MNFKPCDKCHIFDDKYHSKTVTLVRCTSVAVFIYFLLEIYDLLIF